MDIRSSTSRASNILMEAQLREVETGRRHSTEKMQKLLPAGFEIKQERYAALLRRRA